MSCTCDLYGAASCLECADATAAAKARRRAWRPDPDAVPLPIELRRRLEELDRGAVTTGREATR